ncbi:hypothetical protein Ple7327_0246 [Pleurocapsa sp. PCC 7327]|uniref:hypothetical protein n=1 Tax=Pleurocapsa sp. PCC 7327 TaxID=118163 RepID=UPI00029FD7BD|nr:hypothetical protein [Pleurocapsa sp. PCC 7327]AFY75714.1 hypothetical protein Ple7327_0246 [Pleurocapsa sp. PCC 7327]
MKQSEPQFPPTKPLGLVLRRAALISTAQIEVALRDRLEYEELRIGEILALRGWIKAQTADFFADYWSALVTQKWQHPIGYYFRKAALLDEDRVNAIVVEQKRRYPRLRFGELAVEKQWLKAKTVDFFLQAQKCHSDTPALIDIINRVLNSGQINSLQEDRFLAAMLQNVSLSPSEQAGIQEIFKRIQTGQLRVVK